VPLIEPGEAKVTVTPEGSPEAVRTAAVLNPPVAVLVMLEEPEPPCTIETEPGEALRLKPAAATVPESALIRPLPLGLPQPVAKS
jgi:hypothetical protein